MKNHLLLLTVIFLSGCTPIRVVKDMPVDGFCERISIVDAHGANEREVQTRLEKIAENIGANLLLFNPDQPYEVRLIHPAKTAKPRINGVGVAYKCS